MVMSSYGCKAALLVRCSAGLLMTMSLMSSAIGQQDGGQCIPRPVASDPTLPAELAGLQTTTVFEENFDDLPDWAAKRGLTCNNGTEADCDKLPGDWNFGYMRELWHPVNEGDDRFRPSAEISPDHVRGVSGKSYLTWDESWGSPGGWGSESTLARDLPGSYRDIYVEYWMQFEPGYRWLSVEQGRGTSAAKLARVTTWSGTDDGHRFAFLQDGAVFPLQIAGLMVYAEDGRDVTYAKSTLVCSPRTNDRKCGPVSNDTHTHLPGKLGFVDTFGDGAWHKMAFRARYNSAPGVEDGLVQIWYDDELVHERDNVPYVREDGTMFDGFNMLMIGGNMNNYPEPDSVRLEQWLAYDDIRVISLEGY